MSHYPNQVTAKILRKYRFIFRYLDINKQKWQLNLVNCILQNRIISVTVCTAFCTALVDVSKL